MELHLPALTIIAFAFVVPFIEKWFKQTAGLIPAAFPFVSFLHYLGF